MGDWVGVDGASSAENKFGGADVCCKLMASWQAQLPLPHIALASTFHHEEADT
jgi:hypothetical protein